MSTIALLGNPNSGKTTLFNALTGAKQHVGNWPGVTVEKKEGVLRNRPDVTLTDLPGIYSLSPYTLEEVVSRDYLLNEKPDALINIIDATNLERNLYLTTQALETGVPVVVALNMMDLIEKRGQEIDLDNLSKTLGGVPVIPISALENQGLDELIEKAIEFSQKPWALTSPLRYPPAVEKALVEVEELAGLTGVTARYFAVKLLERDPKINENLHLTAETLNAIEDVIVAMEEAEDNDSETLIISGRYDFIDEHMPEIMHRQEHAYALTTSDKIDRIVTSRVLGLPIFALVMFVVYSVSIQGVGGATQDWMGAAFDTLAAWLATAMTQAGVAAWLIDLICNGVIGGVGAVLTFVPQLMILYLFLSFLEGCGYMARIAFIMDRIFRRFGLSGKSFIPFLMATGCAVPSIMATRTIENENDRRMTIIVTSFMPCGAKLPMIAMVAGAFFKDNPFVAPSVYFISIAGIIISCLFLKQTRLFKGDTAPFIIELPEYRLPKASNVLQMMWEKARAFVRKAGTVIFVCSVIIWFLSSYNLQLQPAESADSMLATLGGIVAPIFAPLGFGTWQAAAGTFAGLVAKENLVSTLGVLYDAGPVGEGTGSGIISAIQANFTAAGAMAYMIFNLFCMPCIAAVGAIRREMMSAKWTLFAIFYQTAFAYVVALLVYQIGRFVF